MWLKISSDSPRSKTIRCRDLRHRGEELATIDSRQRGIPGFKPDQAADTVIGLIGAGGLCGEIGEGGARKGWPNIEIFDGDDVELSNLNRQKFSHKDLGKNKSFCLAKNLKRDGYMGTRIVSFPYFFQGALQKGIKSKARLLICGVDNDQTRVFVSRYCLDRRIPAIFTAVSGDGDQGYVFVQLPDGPCFGCLFPDAVGNEITPCPGVPAIKDILKVVSGFVLYAVDTVLMERKRDWNFRMIRMAGFMPDDKRWIDRRNDCRLCSGFGSGSNDAKKDQ